MATTPFVATADLTEASAKPQSAPQCAQFPGSPGSSWRTMGQFEHKVVSILQLVGSGSQAVSFGTLTSAGAKVLLVSVAAVLPNETKAPILVTLNSADKPVEVSQGGFMMLASPEPVAGVLSMSIAHTQNATVQVALLG